MGRRVKKAVYAYGAGEWELQKEILFVYDGWNLMHEKEVSATGDPLFDKFYVWGLDLSQRIQGAGGIGGLVCRVSGGEVCHYFYDANGNVGQVVDPANGAVTARYEYDPFGKAVVADGIDAAGNAVRFSTKYWDEETDLVYYGYRYYDRNMGRWINRDPIREKGSINLYKSFSNNAINSYDIMGLVDKHVQEFMDHYGKDQLYYETKSDFSGEWKEPIPPQYDEFFIYPMIDPYYDEYPEANAYDPEPKCPKGYHYNTKSKKCIYGKPYIVGAMGHVNKDECGYWECFGWCGLNVAIGVTKTTLIQRGLEKSAKKMTRKAAQKVVTKFIPIYNIVSTGVTIAESAGCAITCIYNKDHRGYMPHWSPI